MSLVPGSPRTLPKPRETAASCNRPFLPALSPSVEGGNLKTISDDDSGFSPPIARAVSSTMRHKCRLVQWNEYFDSCFDVPLESRWKRNRYSQDPLDLLRPESLSYLGNGGREPETLTLMVF